MLLNIIQLFIGLLGATIGYGIYVLFNRLGMTAELFGLQQNAGTTDFIIALSFGLIFFFLFFVMSPLIMKEAAKLAKATEKELQKIPLTQMVSGTIGLIIGLLIAFLLSGLLKNVLGTNILSGILSFTVYGIFHIWGLLLPIAVWPICRNYLTW